MIDVAQADDSGLRERKKERTRTRLIDAALELAAQQGYERTTVEQIAEAVDVSPRTFARYFPTKDAVILSVIDQLIVAVHAELDLIPSDVPPFEALLAANLAMLQRTKTGVPISSERFFVLLRVINNSPELRVLTLSKRSRMTRDAIADRLGAAADDRAVTLTRAVWSAIQTNAWCGIGTGPDHKADDVYELCDRMHRLLVDTFAEFTFAAAELPDPS